MVGRHRHRRRRHRSEQNRTSFHVVAQRLRQANGLPHVAHTLVGRSEGGRCLSCGRRSDGMDGVRGCFMTPRPCHTAATTALRRAPRLLGSDGPTPTDAHPHRRGQRLPNVSRNHGSRSATFGRQGWAPATASGTVRHGSATAERGPTPRRRKLQPGDPATLICVKSVSDRRSGHGRTRQSGSGSMSSAS